MDTLDQMRVFVRVAGCGQITAAANTLNTSPGSVSRAIADLEGRLHTRLLNRSTRKIALTQAGEIYLARCKQILSDIERAEEEAGDAQRRPRGKVRVHSFGGFGKYYILPAIKEYRTLFPEVSVDLTLSQSDPGLYEGVTDVAIAATQSGLPDSELVSYLLGDSFSVLCASPGYVQEHGKPASPAELEAHECVILHTPVFPAHQWLLESIKGIEPVNASGSVELNTVESAATAVRASMGIGALPVYAALEGFADGSLVRVLPRFTLRKLNIYALHPSGRYTDARIRTWIEFLRKYFPVITARDSELLEKHNSIANDIDA
ncbi:LysR family transcriptional regulator [Paraburkholderia caribensis]|uniref:LysR family transcriptional regulator n=1 Tax=Paraburkholderia caribensis TaxID=75105 RepID=UPI0031DF465A